MPAAAAHPSPRRARAEGAPPPGALPSYALYGEQGLRQATDWLHVESIAERSQLHGWEIQPHRHDRLFQILVLAEGQAQAWLHGGVQALAGPAVLWLPALVPHGFRFDPAVRGWVVTVLDNHLQQLLAAQPALLQRLLDAPVQVRGLGDDGTEPLEAGPGGAVLAATAGLIAEAAAQGDWRDVALDAALLRLLVALARLPAVQVPTQAALAALAVGREAHALGAGAGAAVSGAVRRPGGASAAVGPPGGGAGALPGLPAAASGLPGKLQPGARAEAHARRFRALVDRRFRQQPSLAGLAAELGITSTQLNRVCQQVLGHSALAVLHGRLVLEAQRELAYSQLGIKQIALGLGFADAGYFTRFFQRHCGSTPSAWRARCAAR